LCFDTNINIDIHSIIFDEFMDIFQDLYNLRHYDNFLYYFLHHLGYLYNSISCNNNRISFSFHYFRHCSQSLFNKINLCLNNLFFLPYKFFLYLKVYSF